MQSDLVPVVTVIVPVYNRANSIGKAIHSVLAQAFEEWELIVIDDCSTDGTREAIKGFNDPRVKLLSTHQNSGAALARNVGLRNAKGQLITFLDSDDEYNPNFLNRLVEKSKEASLNVGIFWSGYIIVRMNGGVTTKCRYFWKPDRDVSPYLAFLRDLKIGVGAGIAIRKFVFDEVGCFDENLRAAEDTDLFLRISQRFSYAYIEDYLITINQSGTDRLSKRFDKIAQAYNVIIPKHLSEIEKHRELRLKYFYKAMWLNYHLGDRKLARSFFSKLLPDNYFNLQAWFIFLLFELTGKSLGARIHIRLAGLAK